MATSWASLEELPLDVHLNILGHLDGRSLARYAECTNRRLALHVAPEVAPFWLAVHKAEVLSAPVVPAPPQTDEPLAFGRACEPTCKDAAAHKSAFVRGLSALEHRCPNCGRQHRAPRDSDAPLDDHGRRQRHLCDFFVARPRADPRLVVDLS